MKINKKAPKLLFLFLISLFLISCHKDLSRDIAKEEIIKKRSFPSPVFYSFKSVYTKDEQHTGGGAVYAEIGEMKTYPEVKDMLNYYRSKSLITIEEEPHSYTEDLGWPFSPTTRTWTSVKILLTEYGRKYLNKENNEAFDVKLWEADITEITGIQEMENNKSARVDYTVSNTNITPFGEFFSNKNNVTQESVFFSLFDDGWRIQ